jgi:hypothetical protein
MAGEAACAGALIQKIARTGVMFTTAQTCTAQSANMGEAGTGACRPMLLLLFIAPFAVVVFVLTSGVRVPSGLVPTKLGWMSDRWLAEYRASHAS